MTEEVSKHRAEAVKLQPEFDRLAPALQNAAIYTSLESAQAMKDSERSLDNIADIFLDAELLHKDLAAAYRNLDLDYSSIKGSKHESMQKMAGELEKGLAGMKKQLDFLKKTSESLNKQYNKTLEELRGSVDAKLVAAKQKIDEYRQESGKLQGKAKTEKVPGSALTDAYKKFTDQQAYVKELENFAKRVKGRRPFAVLGGAAAGA